MKKGLPALVLTGAALSLVLTGCSKGTSDSPATVTVTASTSSTMPSAAASASATVADSSGGTSASAAASTSASGVANGAIRQSDCAVIIDVTGPGGYDERRRSGRCTGSTGELPNMKVAGAYTAKVSVTPPGTSTATEQVLTFTVLGAGE